jgi:polysaccharide chain length determinant protein (PEP-CTERM system associated)
LPEKEISLHETLNQVVVIIARYRWWVLGATCVATIATFLFLRFTPNQYKSEATLLVVQQAVPERYVTPTSTTDITEALQAAAEEVLSRARLLAIADEFGLYASERSHLSPEEIIGRIRLNIDIKPIESNSPRRDVNSFKISFIASDPSLAQEVTSRLTSLFVEQNLETREHQATTTTNFLHDQLDTVKRKLADAEEEVRQFKMGNLGELPEQAQGNMTILTGLQAQLQGTMTSLNRAQEQHQYLESLTESRMVSVQADLAKLKTERTALLDRYTPEHPAVVKINAKIAQAEAIIKTLNDPHAPTTQVLDPSSAADDASLAQLKGQLESNRLEIEHLTKTEKQLNDSIAQYQNRLNMAPMREQQLAGIMRNYDFLKQEYGDLLSKEMQSQLAQNLEKRQVGQQFRLVDRPSFPRIPFKPDRVKTSLGGIGAGVGIGLVLAFFWHSRDRSFHSDEDLSAAFGLPLTVGVPLIMTPLEARRYNRVRTWDRIAAFGLTLTLCAVELYQLYLYRV